MSKIHRMQKFCALVTFLFVPLAVARAQQNRTFISGVGDDANPNCSRTAPCKTFAGALVKTNPGGEIDVLDPGGFGSVTINKAITIDGSGGFASALATSTVNGIAVNAGASDVVILRHLSITAILDQGQSGADGIKVIAAKAVYVIDCLIKNYSNHGIDFQPAAGGALFVRDSLIINNGSSTSDAGIVVRAGSEVAFASIDNTRIDGNGNGIVAKENSKVSVSNSVISKNGRFGLLAAPATNAPAEIIVEHTMVTLNGAGIQSGSCMGTGLATVRISNVNVTGNRDAGLSHTFGPGCGKGEIVSSKNNTVIGNHPDGAATTFSLPK